MRSRDSCPILASVPKGSWFCPACSRVKNIKAKRLGNACIPVLFVLLLSMDLVKKGTSQEGPPVAAGQAYFISDGNWSLAYIFFVEECIQTSPIYKMLDQANWDSSKVKDKFRRDIDAHIAAARAAKLAEITTLYEKKLNEALSGPVESLLDGASDDTWPAIRKLLSRETETTISGASAALSGFKMDEEARDNILSKLKDYAREVVETKAKEEAGRVLVGMKERFSTIFSHDSDSMPRVWTGNEDIKEITKTARLSSLKLLSVTVRLDDEVDNIAKILTVALLDGKSGAAANKSITSYSCIKHLG